MSSRQPLTARLEDLQSELEALRLFRRQRIITNARAFQKQKAKLIKAIEEVQGEIEQRRRSLEIAREIAERERKAKEKKEKAQRKRQFLNTLRRNFASGQAFNVSFGNNFISDREILDYIVRQPGRWSVNVGNNFYTLSDNSRIRLREFVEADLVITEEIRESDGQWRTWVYEVGEITIAPIEEANQRGFLGGEFFKWLNLTGFDFTRYGIFKTIDPVNYEDNCLLYAFRVWGLESTKLEDLKFRLKNRSIPKSDLKKIAEILGVQIQLRTANQDKRGGKPFVYGAEFEPTILLGLLESHYFLIEKTDFTRYSLEHYEEVKNEKECHLIYCKEGNYFKRKQNRGVDSYDLVKILLENKDKLLKEITMDDQLIATTQFYDKVDSEVKTLEYNQEKNCVPVTMPKKGKDTEFKNVFFDFETYTLNGKHIPYLCCTFDGIRKQTFIGENCALQMLCSLTSNTRLIAHNATYDFRFLLQHLSSINELSRGNRLISCSAKFKDYELHIKDSLHLISKPLREFPSMFGFDGMKEVMFYSFFSKETIAKRCHKPIDVFEHLTINKKEFKSKQEAYSHLLHNLENWGLLNHNGEFDIVDYSKRYCEIDCEILCKGYNTFRKWMLDLVNIDIDDVLTIASVAHRYFIAQGCYEGVNELSGIPQNYIQGAVVGGRTMVSENKKKRIEGKINDFDAVSLYPSAMRRMDGFLKGKPKVLTNLSYDFLKQQDGYFVDIRITAVGIHRKFPLMSYKNENSVRMFSNDMIGKIIRVDKYTLEDLIQFQQISFEVLRGYYFNEGFNNKINEVIKFLFEERLRMKKQGNPAQEVYKLIMNSGYGKSIMKPVESETKFFDDEKAFKVFLSRHYNWITQYTKVGEKYKVKLMKTLDEHFNIAHVGTMILSMSKRIMNEVMCLAEDNALEVYYQDTDSNHILDKDIEVLARLFKEKYGRDLIGKGFGQFHSDFEIDGAKDVYSRRAIFLGKKCYIDELVGKDENGNEVNDYHIRMKGIPNECIYFTADALGYKNVFDMYEDLYKGKAIVFDLTNQGKKANFKYQKDYSVETLRSFERKIQFRG